MPIKPGIEEFNVTMYKNRWWTNDVFTEEIKGSNF